MNKSDKLKIFAGNLCRIRNNLGFSKPEAAKKLNIPCSQYYRYEAGAAEPGIFMVIEIANVFNISTFELFRGLEFDVKENDYIDVLINKLNKYGIKSERICGDNNNLFIPCLHPSIVSVSLIDKVILESEKFSTKGFKEVISLFYYKVLCEMSVND